MSKSYKVEKKLLKKVVVMLRNKIEAQDDKTSNIRTFVNKVKRCMKTKQLTPAMVNEFIDYIMISKKQVINGKTVCGFYKSSMFLADGEFKNKCKMDDVKEFRKIIRLYILRKADL